jgi:hypothetical protein
MTIFEIAKMPSSIDRNHESLLRGYQTLQLVIELLEEGTPYSVILRIIREIDAEAHRLRALDPEAHRLQKIHE